ncbi:MAG: hypothetical protein IJT27_00050 [Clostridia bacterium]|nr:hypothetical protein [Clostridia bacterium]
MRKAFSVLTAVLLLLTLFSGCGNIMKTGKTILIYMCGSNLETKQGLAGKNIDEILSAEIGTDLNVVIETGGAKTWRSHGIANDAIQRYAVKNGELVLLEALPQGNMGEADTLADFLVWGQTHYAAKDSMLILWDHGAGAAKGVCYDENYAYDPLTLKELKAALESASLKNKFDLIGFDACLMASVETAYFVYDHARYMVASEEIEPSGGWDYKTVCEAFSAGGDPIATGKAICDAYIKKCAEKNKLFATLSLFDLSKTPMLMNQCSAAMEYIENYARKADYFSEVLNAMRTCEKFGGDNAFQGAANMLDFVDFVYKATGDEYRELIDTGDFVLYSVNGGQRANGGVSFYYPMIYNENEVNYYLELGVNEHFNRFLSAHYSNVPETTITYSDRGSVTSTGAFTVKLDPDSADYFSHIDFILMRRDESGARHVLCTDNDMNKDWDTLTFRSNFRGISLALDGHRLFYSTVSSNPDYISFIAPVIVNGEKTNLRFVFIWDDSVFNGGYYQLAGVWNGYDENGLPDNDIEPLKSGDRVQVVTDAVLSDGTTEENYGEAFTIGENGGVISEIPLDGEEYQYVFVATDIFGNTFPSDMATFEMTVGYDTLLQHPLPDETYAAKVTAIEPYIR